MIGSPPTRLDPYVQEMTAATLRPTPPEVPDPMFLAFIQGIGPTELIIVLVIVLLIFGPKRLPALARSLGGGLREFKDSISSSDRDDDREDATPAPAADAQAALGGPGEPVAERPLEREPVAERR